MRRLAVDAFDDLIATWLELAGAMSLRDLEADAPRASLARGAAGVAYVIGRIAHARGDATLLAASKRWLALARRAARTREGFHPSRRWPASASSLVFGPVGVAVVAASVTPSPRTRAELRERMLRGLSRAPGEYNYGVAGNLLAALAILHDEPAVADVVDRLAARLAALPLPPPGGFAHGDLGVVTARLVAADARGTPIDPAWLATLSSVDIDRALAASKFARSWCNGLAGYTIAWVLAAELAGDDRCRARALAAAPRLLEELDECGGSVCCGLGGRAYALLAVARLDPDGPWLEHAYALVGRAIRHDLPSGGMLQGLPGLVLLAHELKTPETARFPFVDVAGPGRIGIAETA